MKIIDLPQGTDLWREWRKSKITATSAAILMNNNPWRDALDLWEEMLEIKPPQELNAAMARGSELEPIARKLFEEQSGMAFIPIVCESSDHSWMAASLDGWNDDNQAILEIKCPNEKTHQMAIDGIIPIYYRDQIMHQFGCTKALICYYVSYRPEHEKKLAVIEVKPDVGYINHMIDVEQKFYKKNICGFKPPERWKLNGSNPRRAQ